MEITVREVMSRDLLHLHPEDSVGTALTALLGRNLTGAAVIDERGHPLGVLSLRDILGKGTGSTAQERMTVPPIVVREEAAIPAAAQLLTQSGLSRLIVVNRAGRVVGAVGPLELLRAYLADSPAPATP